MTTLSNIKYANIVKFIKDSKKNNNFIMYNEIKEKYLTSPYTNKKSIIIKYYIWDVLKKKTIDENEKDNIINIINELKNASTIGSKAILVYIIESIKLFKEDKTNTNLKKEILNEISKNVNLKGYINGNNSSKINNNNNNNSVQKRLENLPIENSFKKSSLARFSRHKSHKQPIKKFFGLNKYNNILNVPLESPRKFKPDEIIKNIDDKNMKLESSIGKDKVESLKSSILKALSKKYRNNINNELLEDFFNKLSLNKGTNITNITNICILLRKMFNIYAVINTYNNIEPGFKNLNLTIDKPLIIYLYYETIIEKYSPISCNNKYVYDYDAFIKYIKKFDEDLLIKNINTVHIIKKDSWKNLDSYTTMMYSILFLTDRSNNIKSNIKDKPILFKKLYENEKMFIDSQQYNILILFNDIRDSDLQLYFNGKRNTSNMNTLNTIWTSWDFKNKNIKKRNNETFIILYVEYINTTKIFWPVKINDKYMISIKNKDLIISYFNETYSPTFNYLGSNENNENALNNNNQSVN